MWIHMKEQKEPNATNSEKNEAHACWFCKWKLAINALKSCSANIMLKNDYHNVCIICSFGDFGPLETLVLKIYWV